MNRLQRKLVTASSHVVKDGMTVGGEVTGVGIGAISGVLIGEISSGVTVGVGLKMGAKIGGKYGKILGKVMGTISAGTISKTRNFTNLLTNPFDELSNGFIRFLVSVLGFGYILTDTIADKIIQNKSKILLFFLTIFICMVFTLTNRFDAFAKSSVDPKYNLNLPSSVSPVGNPFGESRDLMRITAYFNDEGYYEIFGNWHKAIDVVPTNIYLSTNLAYKETAKVYIYSTCDGLGGTNKDINGAITIEIKCLDNKYIVSFTHESISFLPYEKKVLIKRGEAIGIMGCTGKCTGPHVHYAIKENDEYVDPLTYL